MNNKKFTLGVIGFAAVAVIIIVFVLLLNSGKKLVCTISENSDGIKTDHKIVFTFKKKGDTPSVKETIVTDVSSDPTYTEEKLKKEVDEFNNKAKDKKDGTYNASVSGKVATITSKYTSDQYYNLNKSSIDAMEDKTMDGYKKLYETIGYTCK